jgi:hypothetical protein
MFQTIFSAKLYFCVPCRLFYYEYKDLKKP